MLYGRRVIEPQRVPHGNGRKRFILNKAFQYKYSWYMITAFAGGALLFFIPAYYFISQNYELFKTLAYDTQPRLVEHLEREMVWLRVFLGASLVAIAGVTLFLSIRMTKNLLSPMIKMEQHMHQLMLGQWFIEDYVIPEEDDFRDLSMTYDYFYRALKANTETELKLLEKLSIDPQNREAYAAWKHLLAEKRARLGIKEEFISNDNVAELRTAEHRRRVS
ncbi:hypothetical protein ACLVWU_15930 [Bdellovibrio sp. HCB290]|uniref:hypothetical protein n=1 Tax=Bdellovibrio sp. HCB290 TaxID=3394356 RepID=UPI0039B38DB8